MSVSKIFTKTAILCALFLCVGMPLAGADVYINVMAVNGAPERKEVPVQYNLPGDLKAEDIVDTNGLQVDYNVNDANYYVHGKVTLEPKENKTFRIRVKDIWKFSPDQVGNIKQQVDRGFEQIGKLRGTQKSEVLRQQLVDKLDYIIDQQNVKAESVEKRMDAFRTHLKEMKRIEDSALAVDYWRSDPGAVKEKIVHFKIEVENPLTNHSKMVKEKHYLPSEVKPEHVLEAEGFEVRFDPQKQQSFLFKEEEIPLGEKKTYSIGIQDIWIIDQKDIDYLRKRADYAYDFLKSSKFDQSSKFLYDQSNELLAIIETAQAQNLPGIKEHIGAYRANLKTLNDARVDVENLEKLLSVLREDLEKSKVENVLQKVRSLKGVANVAKQMFDKKPTPSTAWRFIGWILIFVAFLTTLNFIVWVLRSRSKKKDAENLPPGAGAGEQPPKPAEEQAKK